MSIILPLCLFLLMLIVAAAKDFPLSLMFQRALAICLNGFLINFLNIGLLIWITSKVKYSDRIRNTIRIISSYILAIGSNILLYQALAGTKYITAIIPEDMPFWRLHLHSIFTNTIVVITHSYIILLHAKTNAELENARLKFANTEAINQLLRQQIHPHFLFNALNTLKSLIRRHPDKAEDYLIHLSDFLRATITKSQKDIISLREELKLSTDFLEMQKMRVGNALKFSIQVKNDTLVNTWLPAFSLQPLLENAIKHNILTEEDPLYLNIIQEGEHLRVTNNIQLKHIPESSTGSGLTNLSERYKLLCGEDIQVENNGSLFSVKIKILQHAGSYHRG